MKRHAESHMDHEISQAQWDHIFARFADRAGFFIETFELPPDLGTVTNELYGPSAGDEPISDSEVVWGRRGARPWPSRLVLRPKRPTKFVRVIAGPHEEKCARCGGTGSLSNGPISWYVPGAVPCLADGCENGTIKHACILYTAYGVSSVDASVSPIETGDAIERARKVMIAHQEMSRKLGECPEEREAYDRYIAACDVAAKSADFWATHALATTREDQDP